MSAENEAVVRRYLTEAFAAVRDGDLRATRDFLTGAAQLGVLGQLGMIPGPTGPG